MDQLAASISDDRMTAYVSGEVGPGVSEAQARTMLLRVLEESGIVAGVGDDLVAAACRRLAAGKRLEREPVAFGTPATSETPPRIHYSVPSIPDKDIPVEFCSGSPPVIHHAHLVGRVRNLKLIVEGDTVGHASAGEESRPGFDVLGQPVTCATSGVPGVARGLRVMPSGDVIATGTGVLVRSGDRTAVLGVAVHASCAVTISDDRLRAVLAVLPPGPGGRPLDRQMVVEAVQASGLPRERAGEALDPALETGARTGPAREFVIAEGRPARNGEDGRIEYRVDLAFSHAPRIRDDGTADYYSVHVFENVSAGQLLAVVHQPTEGVAGIDVFGNPVRPVRGNPVPTVRGRHVDAQPGTPESWVAARTGHVYLRNDTLLVEETLTIRGDVDFGTGNVDFVGDVLITGDVRCGFRVKAAGSVRVCGAVEDALIDAGQTVIVHGGFVGKGDGRIKAGRDVVVRHVLNQTVVAKNNIMVSGEAIDANLCAGNMVLVEARRSCIVGGTVVARNAIRARDLGNDKNGTTHVLAGVDHFVKHALAEMERDLIEMRRQYGDLTAAEGRATAQGQVPGANGPLQMRQAKLGLQRAYQHTLQRLTRYRTNYRGSPRHPTGLVFVYGAVYPGTAIEIGDRKHTVVYPLTHCLYSVQGDQVVSRPLTESLESKNRQSPQ